MGVGASPAPPWKCTYLEWPLSFQGLRKRRDQMGAFFNRCGIRVATLINKKGCKVNQTLRGLRKFLCGGKGEKLQVEMLI